MVQKAATESGTQPLLLRLIKKQNIIYWHFLFQRCDVMSGETEFSNLADKIPKAQKARTSDVLSGLNVLQNTSNA